MTPDASGKFKGISVPSIPWHEKGHGMSEIKSDPEQDDSLRMSVAAVDDAERALADLHGPERGGDNNLRRLNDAAFVGERYGAALVADWRKMNGALKLIDTMLTTAEGDDIPRGEACKHQARLLARQILGWRA